MDVMLALNILLTAGLFGIVGYNYGVRVASRRFMRALSGGMPVYKPSAQEPSDNRPPMH